MTTGRHGGRVSGAAGTRDLTQDAASAAWTHLPYGVWQGLEVGRVYVFKGGRKGKVLEKKENNGQVRGLPMAKIEWRD